MQIDIQTQSFDLTHALRSYAERRLRFALTRARRSRPEDSCASVRYQRSTRR